MFFYQLIFISAILFLLTHMLLAITLRRLFFWLVEYRVTDVDKSTWGNMIAGAGDGNADASYRADFTTLFRSLAKCLIELDDKGHISDMQGDFAAAGLAHAAPGILFADFIHPRDLPIWRTIVLRLMDAHSVGPVALRLANPTGAITVIDVTAMRQFSNGMMKVQIAINPFLGRALPLQMGRAEDSEASTRLGPQDFEPLAKQMSDMVGGKLDSADDMLRALHQLLEQSSDLRAGHENRSIAHFLASLHALLGHSASECRATRLLSQRRAGDGRDDVGPLQQRHAQSNRRTHVDVSKPMSLSDAIRETLSDNNDLPAGLTAQDDLVSDAEAARAVLYALQNSGQTDQQVRSMNQLTEKLDANVAKTKEQIRSFKKIVLQEHFDIFLQPIVNLATKRVSHFEGLVRFENTIYKGSPFEFIAFAEKMGVIHEFDMAMTMKMVSVIKRLRRIGYEIKGAVNLSGHSIQSPVFLRQFFKLLEDCGDVRDNLSFELTESSYIRDLGSTNSALGRIRQFGHRVALDDFGSGASGLQYLRQLKVDAVKIDGAYVRQAVESNDDRKFLASIVDLCASRDIDIVAECVESQADVDLLLNMGVGYGQGWFFSKPMPIDDALKLLPS